MKDKYYPRYANSHIKILPLRLTKEDLINYKQSNNKPCPVYVSNKLCIFTLKKFTEP